ncbi:MAG: hypothetical protein ACRES8_04275 [Nevskiaceae bacterium]
MKGKGFDRLRGAAIMGVMGLGSLAGGTARAAVTNLPLAGSISSGTRTARWGTFSGTNTAGQTTSGIGNLTWCLNPAVTGTYVSTSGFCFAEAELTVGTVVHGDWIDAAFAVTVDGVMFLNPDGTVDLTDNTVTTDTATVSGVDVKVEMAFSMGRIGVVRILYSFTNDTASPVTKSIAIGGNIGSDSSTTAQWSADGDATIETTDGWYISSDNTVVGGDTANDPLFTLARFEPGADVIPVATSIPGTTDGMGFTDNFVETFDLDIPANSTRRILIFGEMSHTLTEAKAAAASFNNKGAMADAGLLNGLTSTERGQIVNFNVEGGGGGGGGMAPGSLLTLSGLLALAGLRRRRKAAS